MKRFNFESETESWAWQIRHMIHDDSSTLARIETIDARIAWNNPIITIYYLFHTNKCAIFSSQIWCDRGAECWATRTRTHKSESSHECEMKTCVARHWIHQNICAYTPIRCRCAFFTRKLLLFLIFNCVFCAENSHAARQPPLQTRKKGKTKDVVLYGTLWWYVRLPTLPHRHRHRHISPEHAAVCLHFARAPPIIMYFFGFGSGAGFGYELKLFISNAFTRSDGGVAHLICVYRTLINDTLFIWRWRCLRFDIVRILLAHTFLIWVGHYAVCASASASPRTRIKSEMKNKQNSLSLWWASQEPTPATLDGCCSWSRQRRRRWLLGHGQWTIARRKTLSKWKRNRNSLRNEFITISFLCLCFRITVTGTVFPRHRIHFCSFFGQFDGGQLLAKSNRVWETAEWRSNVT